MIYFRLRRWLGEYTLSIPTRIVFVRDRDLETRRQEAYKNLAHKLIEDQPETVRSFDHLPEEPL